ncbi:hypothetical protein BH11ACT8_BH11ACT8_06630 [soil metagenome]
MEKYQAPGGTCDVGRLRRRPGEEGASAVEYALLIAGIAAVLVVVILLLGGQVHNLFGGTCDALDNLSSASSCDP